MKKFEKILGLLAVISVILQFFSIPGSVMLLTFSMMLVAILYYPLGFIFFNNIPLRNVFKKEAYKGISTLKIVGTIGLGMGLSLLCIGILFKLNTYPFSSQNLGLGLFTTLIALLVVIYRLLKTKRSFYRELLIRIAIIGGIGLALLFVTDLSIAKIQFRNNPEALERYKEHVKNREQQKTHNKENIELKPKRYE